MTSTDQIQRPRSGFGALRLLVGDLVEFSGLRGLATLGYVALGALFESIGLILLVPLLGLVVGSSGDGRLQRAAAAAFDAFGAVTPVEHMAVLMGGFVVLMILRAIVISRRDKATQDLNTDFIEHMRARLLGQLAAAGWDQVVRLRHVRVLNALSADIQRAGLAAYYVLQATVAIMVLAAQCVLSFVLAPGLALIAFTLLIVAALALVPALRRARALGRFTLQANLNLVENAAQFLSGLKLAISQDLQGGFVAEYRETLAVLKQRQRSYYYQQISWRVWLTTATAIVGAAVVMAGFAVFHLQAPVLIAFLLVIARMLGPATQLQQGFQLLANGLPAHESVIELVAELKTEAPTALNPLAVISASCPAAFSALPARPAQARRPSPIFSSD